VEMAIGKRIYAMRYALCALRGSVYGHESRVTIHVFVLGFIIRNGLFLYLRPKAFHATIDA